MATFTLASMNPARAGESELRMLGLMKGRDGLITRIPNEAPNAAQQAHTSENRFGMFIHFGINTFVNQEWTDGTVPVETYAPAEIAADEWALAARNAGMSHIVLVCKHHEGFCLWPTKRNELRYSVEFSPNRTDVVKAVADACARHGLRFAVYYSLWDRKWDSAHAAGYARDRAATNRAYVEYMLSHLCELLGSYGAVSELWLDGNWEKTAEEWEIPRIYDLVKRMQPRCQMAVNNTIGPPGSDQVTGLGLGMIRPEHQKEGDFIRYFPSDFRLLDPLLPVLPDPKVFTHGGQRYWMPFESTVCLNDKWFWNDGDRGLKSVDELVNLHQRATAQDNLLLINSPPGPDGRMRPGNIRRLAELRERLGLAVTTNVESKPSIKRATLLSPAGRSVTPS